MKSIVLTGGGTAGHALPHLAVYPYIENDFDKFYYIGSENGIENELMSKHFEYFSITTTKLVRSFTLKNLKIPYLLVKGINEATDILKKLKPSVVFSKGGYVALPVTFAAFRLKIPVIVHESDYTMGLSNKLVAKKSDFVLTSFDNVCGKMKNGIFTGPPVREFTLQKSRALSFFGFSGQKKVLLIMGGSSGSRTINNAITGLLPDLCNKYDVIHLCGKATPPLQKSGYRRLPYLEDMSLAYSIASLCVSRAGAGAAFELMNLKIPTLFIPLTKKTSRGDQILNARYFYERGACNMLSEENLTPSSLSAHIETTLEKRREYIDNMKSLKNVCGSQNIANIIKKYGKSPHSHAKV